MAAHLDLVGHGGDSFRDLVQQRLGARQELGGAKTKHREIGLVDHLDAQAILVPDELHLPLQSSERLVVL